MGRREELEKQQEQTQKLLEEKGKEMPEDLRKQYREQLNSISFELNNLYDDPETETE